MGVDVEFPKRPGNENIPKFLHYVIVLPIKVILSSLPYKGRMKRLLRQMWHSFWNHCILILSLKQRRIYKEFNAFSIRLLNEKEKKCFIVESTISWQHALFQRPQQLSLALGELGHPVIYKNASIHGIIKVTDNVWAINDRHLMHHNNSVRILLSTCDYPDHLYRHDLPDDILVYDYIDHIDEKISGSYTSKLVINKNRMFAEADIVAASAKGLYDEAVASAKGRVILVPNGVDTRHYFSFARKAVPPPLIADFCTRYLKIVGYFGAIAPWLDYDLINALIDARKDLGFIFIGPDYDGHCMNKFIETDNLLLAGTVDYVILPEYAHWFDICWIPFEQGDIAKTTSPLKLFEYFALGKPVVVTSDLRECVVFSQVLQGHDATSFSQSFDKAFLLAKDSTAIENLKQLAIANSWLERARVLSLAVQELAESKCKT